MIDVADDVSHNDEIADAVIRPFHDMVDRVDKLTQFLSISSQGISALRAMPNFFEILLKFRPDDSRIDIDEVKKRAELATVEVESGFPLLHAHYAISLWSCLDNSMRVFIASWLQLVPGALKIDALKKIRVKVGEYESLDGLEKYIYLVDRLETEVSADTKLGIGKFEILLHLFGLSGPVEKQHSRTLIELCEVRNCLLHRSGLVDQRLMSTCPWLPWSIGTSVVIDRKRANEYAEAVDGYGGRVIIRLGKFFHRDMSAVDAASVE